MEQIVPIIQALDGLPLHGLLMVAIVVLWRKINVLEKSLEDCLRGDDSED